MPTSIAEPSAHVTETLSPDARLWLQRTRVHSAVRSIAELRFEADMHPLTASEHFLIRCELKAFMKENPPS